MRASPPGSAPLASVLAKTSRSTRMEDLFKQLRDREFTRLDAQRHVYLDFTGAGLYAESQVRAHAEFLCGHIFGNPHSRNPTSLACTELVEAARRRVLAYFNADPER